MAAVAAGAIPAGIYIGTGQDNYVKLAVINRNGVPGIEFYNELNGTGITTGTPVVLPNAAAISAVVP